MIQRLRTAADTILPKGRLARSALVVSSGHVAGYAIMLAVTPLLTRLYGPADFGVYAVYTSIIAMLGLICMASYEAAIPLPEDDPTALSLVVVALGTCVVASSAVGVFVWLAGEDLLGRLQAGELGGLAFVFTLHLLGSGSAETFTNWFVRQRSFTPIARGRFAASTVNASVQVASAFVVGGATGLVAGSAAGAIAGGGYLLIHFGRSGGGFRGRSAAPIVSTAIRYRRFPQLSMPSTVLQRTALLLPPLALAAFYDSEIVGWYGLAQRALIVPLSLIGPPLSRVYLAEASRLHREGHGQLRLLFLRTAKKQLLYAGLPLMLFVLVAPPFFALAFGEPWREAGVYCQAVFPMLLLFIIASVLAGTLDVLERQDLQLFRSVVLLALVAAGMAIPLLLGAAPRTAIVALSATASAGYLITLWLVWRTIPDDRPGVPSPADLRSEHRRPASETSHLCPRLPSATSVSIHD